MIRRPPRSTLFSLHDALPISFPATMPIAGAAFVAMIQLTLVNEGWPFRRFGRLDRKSTRLNSSHSQISYAVFCLKKKKNNLNNVALYYAVHACVRDCNLYRSQ